MALEGRWNIRRGLNRAFVVFSVCWYIVAGFVLWPQWLTAIKAERAAGQLIDYDALAEKAGEISSTPAPKIGPPSGYFLDPVSPPDLQSFLDGLQVPKSVKADAFDAFFAVAGDFQRRFEQIAIPQEAKEKLWDMRFGSRQMLPSVDKFMAQLHARELRPVRSTAIFSFVPPVIYGFFAAIFWISRGFHADPIKTI